MKMKNDCQVDYIKEAFDKLYSSVMPYIDLTQFADADTAFKELDKKVHSEIYILKKCLDESDRAVEAGITRSEVLQERISDLEKKLNIECKHGEDLSDVNGKLASENADLKEKTSNQVRLLEHSRITFGFKSKNSVNQYATGTKALSTDSFVKHFGAIEQYWPEEETKKPEARIGIVVEDKPVEKKAPVVKEEGIVLNCQTVAELVKLLDIIGYRMEVIKTI